MAKKKAPQARVAFAKRLRATRTIKGYETARSFAHALGIEEDRLGRWERAETEPDLEMLIVMCQHLAVTPNDLILGQKPKSFRRLKAA